MKTLNLVDLDKSNIKYKISKFPDGQQNIKIIDYKPKINGYFDNGQLARLPNYDKCVQIKSRLNNWLDLELIVCTVASLRELDVEEIHLYTPYIMGARSDRKFEEGGNNYLKDVICPVINSLNFKSVFCMDPHSDVLEACIKEFKKQSNSDLVRFSIISMYNTQIPLKQVFEAQIKNNFILVSPDAGASKKIYKLAEQIGYKGDIITCSKDRDKDGKLTKTVVPNLQFDFNKDIIIIDDICDGGATFINITKEIKSQLEFHKACGYKNNSKIYLVVTHGIFSKGFGELSQYFDGIYCTNSYKNIIQGVTNDDIECKSGFVKQLNVF